MQIVDFNTITTLSNVHPFTLAHMHIAHTISTHHHFHKAIIIVKWLFFPLFPVYEVQVWVYV